MNRLPAGGADGMRIALEASCSSSNLRSAMLIMTQSRSLRPSCRAACAIAVLGRSVGACSPLLLAEVPTAFCARSSVAKAASRPGGPLFLTSSEGFSQNLD
jgi:hypothetical protein